MAPVQERRARQKEQLRQEILDAARELFIREGYENVSMRRIAERIDYSPTTIYLYFKDKAELLFELCEETFSRLLKRLEAQLQQGADDLTNLREGLRTYVDFGLRYPNHYRLTFMAHPRIHEEHERHLDPDTMGMRAFAHLRACVQRCVESGALKTMDVELASQALWATVHGITSLLITMEDFRWVDRRLLVDTVIDSAIAGMRA